MPSMQECGNALNKCKRQFFELTLDSKLRPEILLAHKELRVPVAHLSMNGRITVGWFDQLEIAVHAPEPISVCYLNKEMLLHITIMCTIV
jgi:hypothetical protein